MANVTCGECKHIVNKENAIYEKPKYYHQECYAKLLQRRELYDYCCKLFHLKSPGPAIYTQRKRFVEQLGYTDEDILKTLRYIYEVKKKSIKGADERIGLVPYFYDEAMKYWKRQYEKQMEIANEMAQRIEESQKEIVITPQKPARTVKQIDPMDWWKAEE